LALAVAAQDDHQLTIHTQTVERGHGGTDVIAGNEGIDVIVDGPAETNEAFTFPDSVLAALDTL